jgi:hypothetical protein
MLQSKFFQAQHYIKGTRDQADLSYQRPLQLQTEAPQRW